MDVIFLQQIVLRMKRAVRRAVNGEIADDFFTELAVNFSSFPKALDVAWQSYDYIFAFSTGNLIPHLVQGYRAILGTSCFDDILFCLGDIRNRCEMVFLRKSGNHRSVNDFLVQQINQELADHATGSGMIAYVFIKAIAGV